MSKYLSVVNLTTSIIHRAFDVSGGSPFMYVRCFLDGVHVDRNLGANYLDALHLRHTWPLLPYWTSYVGLISCKLVRLDHTFKVANSVRMKVGNQSRKCYSAMLTACNEVGLVMAAVMTKTKSHEDMEIPLRGIAERNPNEPVQTVITDNPEGDKKLLEKLFPGAQLLADIAHGLFYFGKSVSGFSSSAYGVMKDVSKALWETVASPRDAPAKKATPKRFVTQSEVFGRGLDSAFRTAQSQNVRVNANKWFAAKRRMMAFFERGYYAMPLMGAYIDTPGLGSITTRGTNCEEAFHRCIRTFVKGGQSCAVTLHTLIVGFTAKYNMNKVARLSNKRPGAMVMDFKLNNANRLLSQQLEELVDDEAGMAQLNDSHPLKLWTIIPPLNHSDNTFLGVLTWTGDSVRIEEHFEQAVKKFEADEAIDNVTVVDDDDEEFEDIYNNVRYFVCLCMTGLLLLLVHTYLC
jgi:hypothetical protein